MPELTATSLYRYYDDCDTLIYVGITSRGMQRNVEHTKSKTWWTYVARQDVEHYTTRDEALTREAALVLAERPPFNTQHNPSHKMDRALYIGARVKMADQPTDLAELWRRQNKTLPLTFLPGQGFLTQPEHMAISSRLQTDGAVRVINGSVVVGRVRELTRRGPFLFLEATVRQALVPVTANADVKMTTERDGVRFTLSRLRVS